MNSLPGSPQIPGHLKEKYSDWGWEVAYQYGPDGLTYLVSSSSGEARYLKLARPGGFPGIEDEAVRMIWASNFLPVPKVIAAGSDQEVGWLVTQALPGRDATDPSLTEDPRILVSILAKGLRRFHEVPVETCPFDFRLGPALAHVQLRLHAGQIEPDRDFHEEFGHLSADEAVSLLEQTRPDSEDLVVCHGDYCLPNILIQAGVATGFVDLGELGVADRWWDLAVATLSVTWNLGPGYEELLLKEYGVEPDPNRLEFYRLLYDVIS